LLAPVFPIVGALGKSAAASGSDAINLITA